MIFLKNTGVMRNTVFCPIYCIGAPSILFLQQYVIIYTVFKVSDQIFLLFQGFSNFFGQFWRIIQYFWSILENYDINLIKKTLALCLDIDQNNNLGSLVNGNLAKIVGWTLKNFLIWWCHFYDTLCCFGFIL